ncbi:metallo-beta-lactamase [Pectobacterium brasiliense]|uniref:MBL fold metallo-hydrolase n=1 Tax=Pectobacterium brasiliense TaxID=180957 RepID=UPI00057F6DCA|nr:MBL fold metallo-hydrolase [Pectobacterium brasiliense]KHS91818.1 metallo-beta-lactamase [Pectobacterium brasiliense]MBA0197103.1 MBL fold metallo-hydrolase [Pectobacterium brasiliense]MBN3094957.1 MBL fold metallo-hydrolase [Pectobacterium brasiliense]MBN3139415.1 MBL fold metallo-hydrolase [Pectobacterium brasiliense]MBN3230145.1 MBL fold metallo-hydrolase [Pectobacterium brasiliense]
MANISTFEVGYCLHPGCMALRGAGWKVCRFPARVWMLESQGKRWLWDTGYAQHFTDATRSGLFQLYRRMTPVHFETKDALIHQLHGQGIQPADIDGLIISHFHGDHIAGLRDFPDVPFICSALGWQQTRNLRGFAALKRAFVPALIPEHFEQALQFVENFPLTDLPAGLAPFTQGYALPGSDKEIVLVPLPGHAVGHVGAFVLTENGWVLLASDAAWSPHSYREGRGPSRLANLVMDDPKAYYHTLDQLHQLHLNGQVEIRLCHEGDL